MSIFLTCWMLAENARDLSFDDFFLLEGLCSPLVFVPKTSLNLMQCCWMHECSINLTSLWLNSLALKLSFLEWENSSSIVKSAVHKSSSSWALVTVYVWNFLPFSSSLLAMLVSTIFTGAIASNDVSLNERFLSATARRAFIELHFSTSASISCGISLWAKAMACKPIS